MQKVEGTANKTRSPWVALLRVCVCAEIHSPVRIHAVTAGGFLEPPCCVIKAVRHTSEFTVSVRNCGPAKPPFRVFLVPAGFVGGVGAQVPPPFPLSEIIWLLNASWLYRDGKHHC